MNIVAASRHGGAINAIVPPIVKLRADGSKVVIISHGEASRKTLTGHGLSYKTIGDYGLTDVSVDSMTQLLSSENPRPDLVLVGTVHHGGGGKAVEGDSIDQTLTLAAKYLKIKTLVVLDSYTDCAKRFSNPDTGEVFKFLPDKIAVPDNATLNHMKGKGFNPDWLEVTGNPCFDNLVLKERGFGHKQRKALRAQIGFPDVDFLIFFAANVFQEVSPVMGYWDLDIIKIMALVQSSLSSMNIGVIIGLHPTRTPEKDQKLISNFIRQNSQMKLKGGEIDSRELILATDITTTSYSTIGIEAVHMGKSCLSLQPGLRVKDLFLPSVLGIVPPGKTPKDCFNWLMRMIRQPDCREGWIRKAADFRTSGKATERVIKLIQEMVS